ncbi:hypothetical protein F0562_002132 [Nyssa sinensis]|uniref:glutathione transferase n=1 Tax=Nyssa sinensis TaxID=561372 RepID=A0A5J5C553_9ASTE|nr:hypothetical protein F0562_002132 [Nyssa sinensis]
MEDNVVPLDFWPSLFGMRVRIALAEKGVEYESKEENLSDKSPLLPEMNPVHKMIPVLIHNGKPITESLIILQYIDDVWHDKSPLLPSDPCNRSQAKFWADFIGKKIYSIGKRVMTGEGEAKEVAKKELIECLKTLEGELGDKLYFGDETVGFVEVALVPFYALFYSYETCGNFSIDAECPKLVAWGKRGMEIESISKSLPDPEKIYSFTLQLKQRFGI